MRPQVPIEQLDERKLRKQIRQNREDLVDPDGSDERAQRRRRAEEIKREQANRRLQALNTVLFKNNR